MKKIIYVFLMLSFILFSCGGSSEQTTEDNDEAVTTEQSEDLADEDDATIKNCDEFLDNYDKWTDDYLEVLEAYTKDPTNIEISQEYMALAESLSTWYSDWTDYVACASSEKYQKRFEEISDKVDDKLTELDLQD